MADTVLDPTDAAADAVAPVDPAAPPAPPPGAPTWSTRRFRIALVVIALAGLAIRVAYVLILRRHTDFGGDPLYYHRGANLLADGKGFINPYAYARHRVVQAADHPPLYLVYLSAFSLVGITSVTGHLLASTLLGTASIVVAGLAGREIAGARTGLIAALLVAVYPLAWRYDGMLLSETLVILLVLVAVWTGYRYWHRPTLRGLVVVAVVAGLGTLARSELVLLAPLLVAPLALLGPGRSTRQRLGWLLAGALAFSVVVGPWVGYNLSRFDHPVLLSENLGGTLASSNCDDTYYGPNLGYWNYFCGQDILDRHGIGPYEFKGASDRYLREDALAYVSAHKSRVPVVVAARVGRITGLFRPRQSAHLDVYLENTEAWVSNLGLASYYLVAGLTVVGLVILRRRRTGMIPVVAPILTVLLTTALFYAATRFRATAEGVLCVVAAVTVDAAIAWFLRRRSVTA